MRETVMIGVMGAGEKATRRDREAARRLGRFIASRGWVLLGGGRNLGVMEASCRGARECKGLTVGILPGDSRKDCSEAVLLPIVTDMGNARNNINVLSSDIVVAIAFNLGAGTLSEAALALKAGKPLVLLTDDKATTDFFGRFSSPEFHMVDRIADAEKLLVRLVAQHFPNAAAVKLQEAKETP